MRRVALLEEGEEQERDRTKKRAGIPAKRVAEVIKRGARAIQARMNGSPNTLSRPRRNGSRELVPESKGFRESF